MGLRFMFCHFAKSRDICTTICDNLLFFSIFIGQKQQRKKKEEREQGHDVSVTESCQKVVIVCLYKYHFSLLKLEGISCCLGGGRESEREDLG